MLSVEPIKAYTDNYIWLVSTNEGSIVVDPGESKEILNLIDTNKIDLKGVLITHHHYDHTNGLLDLTNKINLEVYGPKKIEGINNIVNESDKFSIIGIDFEVIEIPGHTLDHLAFYSSNNEDPILFCGDTLFAGGCGRVFEGTFEQMFMSLKKISISPKTTVFLLLAVGVIFIALLFYTFETLLIFCLLYLVTIPISIIVYRNQQKENFTKISDEDHEDIL